MMKMRVFFLTDKTFEYLQEKIRALGIEDDQKLAAYVAEVLSERLSKTAAIKALKSLGSSLS